MNQHGAEQMRIDREMAFALVAETMSDAERAFGRKADGTLLERYALEAAITLLSRPTKVIDFLPDLAMRQVRDTLATR